MPQRIRQMYCRYEKNHLLGYHEPTQPISNYGLNQVELVRLYSINNNTSKLAKQAIITNPTLAMCYIYKATSFSLGCFMSEPNSWFTIKQIFDFLEKYSPWFLDYTSCAYPLFSCEFWALSLGFQLLGDNQLLVQCYTICYQLLQFMVINYNGMYYTLGQTQ